MFSGLAIDTPLCKHSVNTVSKLSWQGGADAFVSCNAETWCSGDHFPMCYDMHTIAYKIIVAGRHSKPFPGAHIHACIHTYIHTYIHIIMHIIHTSRQRFQQYNSLGGPRAGSHQSPSPASWATKLLEATTCAFPLGLASSAPVARSADMQAVTTY